MCIFLNKIFIGCCLMLLQSYVAGHGTLSCDNAKLIISKFVNSEKATDWNVIEDNADKLQHCKCEMGPIFYYIYRMKVVLPNSQALHGVSPDEFVSSQKLKMSKQVKILNGCEKVSYMLLVTTMIKQGFDVEITETAKDLKKKLARQANKPAHLI